jgi:hypothetical protein
MKASVSNPLVYFTLFVHLLLSQDFYIVSARKLMSRLPLEETSITDHQLILKVSFPSHDETTILHNVILHCRLNERRILYHEITPHDSLVTALVVQKILDK